MKLTVLLISAAFMTWAADQKVKNEKVLVTEDQMPAGGRIRVNAPDPYLIVFLDAAGRVKAGEVHFHNSGELILSNPGSSDARFVMIQFRGKGQDETWGKSGISPNYKVLLENRYARVYDIRIPAGTKEPQHTHHDRVVICLAGARMEHVMPDGRTEPSTLATGEVAWRGGATHVGHNMDTKDLWVIAI